MVAKDDKRGTWYARFKIKDTSGNVKERWKRGFKTKREALDWQFEQKKIAEGSTNMLFSDFCNQIFLPFHKLRLKASSYLKYEYMVSRLCEYYGRFKLDEITPANVVEWQNTELKKAAAKDKSPSKTYIRDYHRHLSMVFSHAMKYYGLKQNPAAIVGNFKDNEQKEMSFWTIEEFRKFETAIADEPVYAISISCLYYLGLRRGELMALQPGDFDFENNCVSITKTRYRSKGGIFTVTSPKTPQSVRKVTIPKFLVTRLKEYIKTIPNLSDETFVFPVEGATLRNAMIRNSKKAGIKCIRVHDLRHSHVSLLINQGFGPVAIGKRVGHKSSEITFRYAHLFPHVEKEIADTLDALNESSSEEE